MEKLFLYAVYLTPGVIGAIAVGYVIHCVLSLVRIMRKKSSRGSLFGAVRTFLFAAIVQFALSFGAKNVWGYFPTSKLIAELIYLVLLFSLVALIARRRDKRMEQS